MPGPGAHEAVRSWRSSPLWPTSRHFWASYASGDARQWGIRNPEAPRDPHPTALVAPNTNPASTRWSGTRRPTPKDAPHTNQTWVVAQDGAQSLRLALPRVW